MLSKPKPLHRRPCDQSRGQRDHRQAVLAQGDLVAARRGDQSSPVVRPKLAGIVCPVPRVTQRRSKPRTPGLLSDASRRTAPHRCVRQRAVEGVHPLQPRRLALITGIPPGMGRIPYATLVWNGRRPLWPRVEGFWHCRLRTKLSPSLTRRTGGRRPARLGPGREPRRSALQPASGRAPSLMRRSTSAPTIAGC